MSGFSGMICRKTAVQVPISVKMWRQNRDPRKFRAAVWSDDSFQERRDESQLLKKRGAVSALRICFARGDAICSNWQSSLWRSMTAFRKLRHGPDSSLCSRKAAARPGLSPAQESGSSIALGVDPDELLDRLPGIDFEDAVALDPEVVGIGR